MEPITLTIAAAWLASTAVSGYISNRADAICHKYLQKKAEEFKKLEKPVNGDLQKAVLSSHWLATKIFLLEIIKNSPDKALFDGILHLLDQQHDKINDKNYVVPHSPDSYQVDLLILKEHQKVDIVTLKNAVIDFHLAELRQLFVNDVTVFTLFENAIKTGFDGQDWFELACAFLNELLKGDNNKAKDAFQNQELAKIGLNTAEIRQTLQGFDNFAKNIERFDEFKALVANELREIKGSLNRLEDSIITLHGKVDKLLEGKQLNLNDFPEYSSFLREIDELNIAFDEKRSEKQELLELLNDETDERKSKRFEKNLSETEQELITIDGKRTDKKNDFESFKSYIEKTWLSFYAENTKNSPRLQTARVLFENGDLKAANEVLNPESLQKDFDNLQKLDEAIKNKRVSLSQEFLTKANFTVLEKANKNWFTEANQYYTQAIELNENYNTCFALANFLHNHNQITEAILINEKTLNYASSDIEKAIILNNLGILQFQNNEYSKAEQNYKEALKIRRNIALKNPQIYLPEVARTLNNLGILQQNKIEYKKAKNSYEEALRIFSDLASVNPQTYLQYVAATLNNLGALHQNELKYEKAEQYYEEALKIRRDLASVNQQTYLHSVATTLNNLGTLQNSKKEYLKAEQNYKEALKIRRNLALMTPQTFLPEVAVTLNNLGNLQEYSKAEQYYEEALQIRYFLAQQNPQVYQISVAETLINFTNFYRHIKPNKNKSLELAYDAYINAYPYHQEVLYAHKICKIAVQIWQEWGYNLIKYLEQNKKK